MFSDIFQSNIEPILFNSIGQEFEYLETIIDILITNYKDNFKNADDNFKNEIQSLKDSGEYYLPLDEEHAPDTTYGEIMEYNLSEPYIFKLSLFSTTIIESLLVKHLAYIENILVNLSFYVQKKEKERIPPDYNSGSSNFTDMLKAVKYISIITDKAININKLKQWKIITHLRTLRHKLAHGETTFNLEEGIISEVNKELLLVEKTNIISIVSIDPNTKSKVSTKPNANQSWNLSTIPKNDNNIWECHISSDIEVLKKLNKICQDFINEVKEIYKKKYFTESKLHKLHPRG